MAENGRALSLFLDSSVLFSAVYSVTGGSSKLFTLKKVKLTASSLVLIEVERNVREKLQDYHLERFFKLVERLEIIESKIMCREVMAAKKIIAAKDVIILADFLRADCSILATLDKKDFLQEKVVKLVRPGKILTPKMFFELTGQK